MNRSQALERVQKATITTTVAADGLLDPTQSRSFIRVIKDKGVLSQRMRVETPTAPSGELNKLSTGSRLIRAAAENADDGYRAEATFPTVPYATAKIRLPWEVTEDTFHENIEGQQLEADLIDEMTQQFALDIEDLEINGDTGSGNAFIQINNGLLKLFSTVSGIHRIDGSTINGGAFVKDHFFAMVGDLPNKYASQGNLAWIMSPGRKWQWIEELTDRATAAGDAALTAQGSVTTGPLDIPIITPPAWDDTRVALANPRNFVRVISWQIRKRKVTGETDWELATRDKRGYIYFMKHDIIIEEPDAVVDLHTLDAL